MIDETAEEIAAMQTHSSSVVAVKAAQSLRDLFDREFPTVDEYLRALEHNSDTLRRANRSHASLHTTQRTIVTRVRETDPDSVEAAKLVTEEAVTAAVERVEQSKRRAADQAQALLPGEATLLVHDYSTTVLAALARATQTGASFTVYIREARPRYLGRKMARRLAEFESLDTRLLVDAATGHYLSDCDRVLVGMDCIVGDRLYNRVGTYPLAATAADAGVPMTAIGSAAKIIESGFDFENEHRPVSEVMREPAEGFRVENLAYDATPVRLPDSVVTGESVYDPATLTD
ncbi:MAG: translation initiation factor 2B subunit II family (IF-2BII) [halophilic archaeon J07HX64]|jgi:translation initiation factor 2B subunit II family (IF-2BII)|nr:MAG: translation initiation factor 2B subunit II family (IF-2BII) [halophilic archaeon J07HX64]